MENNKWWTWPEQTLSLNGILESGETYVIAHNSANSTITVVLT